MKDVEIVESFNSRFNKALQARDKKPIDVVNATGISESAISQYRSGLNKPKRDRLVKIANYLNVNPSWLMGLDVPMENIKTISPLSRKEIEYLEKIRNVNLETRKLIFDYIDYAYENYQKFERMKAYYMIVNDDFRKNEIENLMKGEIGKDDKNIQDT